ncbi:MAG: ATP-binding protein [Nitrospiraceae bacterium]|nr:ATP-binding protein [Nitrospiraceae bacterium]
MDRHLRALLIEDNPSDARLIKEIFSFASNGEATLEIAQSLTGGLELLENPPDIVLLDLSLPESRGMDTFFRVREKVPNVPIVLLTGLDDEETAIQAIKSGAQDYIVKGKADESLWRSINYAMERKRLLNEREGLIGELDLTLRELKVLADHLQKRNRELEEFAAVAAHDLKSPLQIIVNYLRLLQSRYGELLDARGLEYIDIASTSSKRMAELIDNLLRYSRLDMELPVAQIESGQALSIALKNLEVRIAESGAVVTSDALPEVVCNDTRLSQLFQNLIDNAIKFRGSAPPRVHVSCAKSNGEFCFTVRDNGIGIAPGAAERIFNAFQRLHDKGDYPGTGLGLAICRKIVQKWGGRIWVEPGPESGSVFCFTIPMEDK